MEYQPTIGLEIHVELKTSTKMFCDCANDPTERHPNIHVCPICLGHPGALPVPNKTAIESVIRVGLALGATINPLTKFDRKNYFYPDLPKGYQISQYDLPLVVGGSLNGIRITRIHLEEDVARSQHAPDGTLIDFNRSSVPLMELVTEPDVRSAKQAGDFARELQLLLRTLGVSDADMEKGQMRIEPNVSLNMGTKVELKNINSFKAVEAGITYEVERQKKAIEAGEALRQETRGWDEVKKQTVHQRFKEHAQDYRYFPEPDIPPFETAAFDIEHLRANLPELPAAKRMRLAAEYALPEVGIEALVFDHVLLNYFEQAVSELREKLPGALAHTLFHYLTSDVKGMLVKQDLAFENLRISPEHFAHLIFLLEQKTIGSRQAKDLLELMQKTGEDPETLIAAHNLAVVSDEASIGEAVDAILAAHPTVVQDYKNGKEAALQFLIGRAMGHLKGKGNPQALKEAFLQKIS